MNAGRPKDLSNPYNGPAWEYRCSVGPLPSSRCRGCIDSREDAARFGGTFCVSE